MSKNSALLLAGGSGTRMAAATGGGNKVLLDLGGEPVLCHSLRTLLGSRCFDRVVLVHRDEDRARLEERLDSGGLAGSVDWVVGGKERFDSVHAGLEFLSKVGAPKNVLIHDSARPFVTTAMIEESLAKAAEFGASTVAVPLSDTLKREDGGFLVETLPRKHLYRIQTPQAFDFQLLFAAHKRFRNAPDPMVTDDCMLLEKEGRGIAIVSGCESNIKITTPFDLKLAQAILEERRNAAGEEF
jgi:2-C-methyl-D-erythritol 4-phosphate cytidylyltransferase